MTSDRVTDRRATTLLLALLVAIAALLLAATAAAQPSVNLRHSFEHIPPYTAPPSPPITQGFDIPGPGLLHMKVILSPYYRGMEPVQFRSKVPVDGADLSVFRPRMPGGESIDSKSTPERWVDGADLEMTGTVRFRKARPQLEVGLFPSVVRFGDGSLEQLKGSLQVELWFEPDGAPATGAAGSTRWATVVETLGSERWTAEWTLLADGVTFDATWQHQPGGDTGVNRAFARIVQIDGNRIVIDRPGLGRYTGRISADRRTITGTVSWGTATWRATLTTPLPTGGARSPVPIPADGLGREWTTTEAIYVGTWVRRGTSEVWDATWPNGAVAILRITRQGNTVIVERKDLRGPSTGLVARYEGTLSGDGQLRGTEVVTYPFQLTQSWTGRIVR